MPVIIDCINHLVSSSFQITGRLVEEVVSHPVTNCRNLLHLFCLRELTDGKVQFLLIIDGQDLPEPTLQQSQPLISRSCRRSALGSSASLSPNFLSIILINPILTLLHQSWIFGFEVLEVCRNSNEPPLPLPLRLGLQENRVLAVWAE